eukprot:129070_1
MESSNDMGDRGMFGAQQGGQNQGGYHNDQQIRLPYVTEPPEEQYITEHGEYQPEEEYVSEVEEEETQQEDYNDRYHEEEVIETTDYDSGAVHGSFNWDSANTAIVIDN